jgi:hypothetical protein
MAGNQRMGEWVENGRQPEHVEGMAGNHSMGRGKLATACKEIQQLAGMAGNSSNQQRSLATLTFSQVKWSLRHRMGSWDR